MSKSVCVLARAMRLAVLNYFTFIFSGNVTPLTIKNDNFPTGHVVFGTAADVRAHVGHVAALYFQGAVQHIGVTGLVLSDLHVSIGFDLCTISEPIHTFRAVVYGGGGAIKDDWRAFVNEVATVNLDSCNDRKPELLFLFYINFHISNVHVAV